MTEIYSIPILNRMLLHSPLHEISAVVNSSTISALTDGNPAKQPEWLTELAGELEQPVSQPSAKTGELDPDFIGFITTRACNIACEYCDFGGPTASKTVIDPAIIRSSIRWMAEVLARRGRKKMTVHLFGGEPFFSQESVDLIVHLTRWACDEHDLTPWFEASTNGVLSEQQLAFVGDYIDGVVLSLDGPREFHDRNRPAYHGKPTFDCVEKTARVLSELPCELCLRACITSDSVRQMESIAEWMCREFQPKLINFEPLTENELTRKSGLTPGDPFEFAIHWYRAHLVAKKYGIRLVYSAAETMVPRITSCPVGTDTLIISPDGRASACYMLPEDWKKHGMDMDIGKFTPEGQPLFDLGTNEHVRNLVMDKPRCESCFCKWTCAGGCHVTQTYRNCSTQYNDFCLQTRMITALLILEQLEQPELIEGLLADRKALKDLAEQQSDIIPFAQPNQERRESIEI